MDWKSPFGPLLGEAAMPEAQGQPQAFAPPSPKMGRGQLIMGIIADALAGAQGRPGMFAGQIGQQRERERKKTDEDVRWRRDRAAGLEDYERKQQIEQRYKQPEVPPMLRDVQAYLGMTPEQRAAWQQMTDAKKGDPDVFITLPNGQVYAGPKSGLAAAMMGGGQAPPKPVGKLTPIDGGPAPQAPGTFRP